MRKECLDALAMLQFPFAILLKSSAIAIPCGHPRNLPRTGRIQLYRFAHVDSTRDRYADSDGNRSSKTQNTRTDEDETSHTHESDPRLVRGARAGCIPGPRNGHVVDDWPRRRARGLVPGATGYRLHALAVRYHLHD